MATISVSDGALTTVSAAPPTPDPQAAPQLVGRPRSGLRPTGGLRPARDHPRVQDPAPILVRGRGPPKGGPGSASGSCGYALSQDRETETELEAFADAQIEALQAEHGSDIETLPPDRKDGYRQVRLTARDPQARLLGVFEHIEGRTVGSAWEAHLYLDDDERFLYDFKSSWEPLVLQEAIAAPGFLGWLRVEDRKDWALTIPYRTMGEVRPMYPDFLVFRQVGAKVAVDILDPHDPTRDDWLPKVKGLAEYAAKHWAAFGRIEACFLEKKVVRRLDLRVERNRKAALQADGPNSLRSLFNGG